MFLGLLHGDVADVFHRMSERLQAMLQSGDTQRGRTHIHSAAALAEGHRDSDDANLLCHAWNPRWFPPARRRQPVLRLHAIYHPRERNDFTDVLSSANPRYRAFQAQSEACVRNAAVTAKIQIPAERLFRAVAFAQPLSEQIVIGDAFAAANDFAVAFGREHVKSESQFGS